MQQLLAMLSTFMLSMSYQLKVVASIVVFRSELDSGGAMQLEAKRMTKDYHDHVQTLSKDERRGSIPPYILVILAIIDVGTKIAVELYQDAEHPIRKAFTVYASMLAQLSNPDKMELLMDDWRYARFRTTHTAARSIMELGISPICCDEAKSLLRSIMKMVCDPDSKMNGVKKQGVAPKTRIENRIEEAIRSLRGG
jgi:hypothetical protein